MIKLLYTILISITLAPLASQQAIAIELTGETLYTQVNMYSLKSRVVTWANFNIDTLIPVNTAVIIKPNTGDKVYFAIKGTTTRLAFKNNIVSGFSGKDWLKKHFSKSKVELSKFTPEEHEAIKEGRVQAGMSKASVIIARGFPPATLTPKLTSNEWVYLNNRREKEQVTFVGDKVSQVLH